MFKMSLGKWQMRNMMTMQIKMVARLTSLFDELFLLLLTWAYLKKTGWIKVENQENADQRMSISIYLILFCFDWIFSLHLNYSQEHKSLLTSECTILYFYQWSHWFHEMDGMLLLYIIQIDYIKFIFDKSIQNFIA